MLPMTTRQFTHAVHAAANMAEIEKRVTPHALRHYAELRIIPITAAQAGFAAVVGIIRSST